MDGEREEPIRPTPIPVPMSQLRFVSQDELAVRMEPVKTLSESKAELYRLVKDSATGEHYLHFAVYHLHMAAGGAEEEYHHLMPLSHDDVIAFALGNGDYVYPANWKAAYLRNGPDGGFVWYDPSGADGAEEAYEDAGAAIRERLLAFRRSGVEWSEDEIKKLLDDIDRQLPPGN
ncbi:hypothetical protein ACFPPD_02675 [Cohnella suwonensis]|uniref:SMI1/KNR4 family protein n=1 Tax=Cohnella suwonensis TaxID=696072 RepID=A0ABW0LQR1_9BACL